MTAQATGRQDPLLAGPGKRLLYLGNEAIIRGALEAGVRFACGYPGTPSSEITDGFARLAGHTGITFEYSVNEKIAVEMAFAASLAGARSIVAMKHLGLMYAGDPLTTIPYIGVNAGMVIVSAADPSCRTSPNEQDQRFLGPMVHMPVIEPATAQQALEMTRAAFEVSEQSSLPVLLRPTTRICHTRAPVTVGALRTGEVSGFVRDPRRHLPVPANAVRMRREIENRMTVASDLLGQPLFCEASGEGRRGVLAFGAAAAVCGEVLAELGAETRFLRLGVAHPLPEEWLTSELRGLDELWVIEELSAFLEDAIAAHCHRQGLATKVRGKRTGDLPKMFEYEPEVLRTALAPVAARAFVAPGAVDNGPQVAPRPPVLCAACPHRSSFFAARSALSEAPLFFNDIGCYTLGCGQPLESGDALLCMGAGFTLAAGAARVSGERTVGFMGDSTFFHSGMPALLNAIKEDVNMVAVILDNDVTAMTGFQESPLVDVKDGQITRRTDIVDVVRALGAKRVERIDPEDLPSAITAFREAWDYPGLAVIVSERPCPVFAQREGISTGARTVFAIDTERCKHCGRESCGQRCSQGIERAYERAMVRARSQETGAEQNVPPVAACATACPLFLCVQGYAAHIAAGRYADALELIMDGLPLPDSVCRVCHRPCEDVCVRAQTDSPVAINDLKRFVVDWADAQPEFPYRLEREPDHGRSVAVVGAGPAGLAAAHELRVRGYAVTLLDAADEPGGLLRYGIPAYRLPREALAKDIRRVLDLGIRFEGGRRLGSDFTTDELLQHHDGVVIAIGAGKPARGEVPGDGPQQVDALAFLRDDNCRISGEVVVIGGGNAAVDAARSALRRGASGATIVCLEARDAMPAISAETKEAVREGVNLRTATRVTRLTATGVETVCVRPAGAGALLPSDYDPVEGSARQLPATHLIWAIGQTADREALGPQPSLRWEDGCLAADPLTGQTSHARIFAAGDVVNGERTVTGAIALGRRAAWGLDRSLRGDAADTRQPPPLPSARDLRGRPGAVRIDSAQRAVPAEREASGRTSDFSEVVGVLTEEQAQAEAQRCTICGNCGNCNACVDLFGCPAFVQDGAAVRIDEKACTGCGVCVSFCPTGAIHAVTAEGGP
ncbi:MAG: FAD-dependent oxidoreductase [Planctomycetes bacterium]|nr:FAD-dependent oxidoreductase [Planctomycetota bacterium]